MPIMVLAGFWERALRYAYYWIVSKSKEGLGRDADTDATRGADDDPGRHVGFKATITIKDRFY